MAGALTRDVRDTARLLDVMAGPTPQDRTSMLQRPTASYEQAIETLPVAGLRAAWSADLGHAVVESEVADICEAAATRLIAAADLRTTDLAVKVHAALGAWVTTATTGLRGALEVQGLWPERRAELTPMVRDLLDEAGTVTRTELARALEQMRQVEVDIASAFKDADVIFTPTSACLPWAADGAYPLTIDGRDAAATGPDALMMVANLCWIPAVSVPAGRASDGRPVGLQIMVPRGRDDIALRLARIFEQTSPWPLLAPGWD